MGRSGVRKKLFKLDGKAVGLIKKRTAIEERIRNIEAEKAELLSRLDEEEREKLKDQIPPRNIKEENSEYEKFQADRGQLIEGLNKARRSNKEMKALLRDIQAIVESLANEELGKFTPVKPSKENREKKANLPIQGDSLMGLLQSPLFRQLAIRIISYLLSNTKKK